MFRSSVCRSCRVRWKSVRTSGRCCPTCENPARLSRDADIVLFIYRDDYYDDESEEKNNAEVIIAKNRHGATGSVFLQWIGQYTTFYNQDRRHE